MKNHFYRRADHRLPKGPDFPRGRGNEIALITSAPWPVCEHASFAPHHYGAWGSKPI